ncbi:hypothetical protein J6590_050774 [Homalodisca vitripennis]|nr:hypothetical protein J6590_050774 [Homalodisca vitripennis]
MFKGFYCTCHSALLVLLTHESTFLQDRPNYLVVYGGCSRPVSHSRLPDILREFHTRRDSSVDRTDDTIEGSCVCFCVRPETVPCWRPATITPHQQGGALVTEQTVPIWVSFNLSSPLSLLKNLVVSALYQYSRPSPLSEADNIANPRGGVAEP